MKTNGINHIFSKQQKIANKIFSFCSAADLVRLSKTCKSARKALKGIPLPGHFASRSDLRGLRITMQTSGPHTLLDHLTDVKVAEDARDDALRKNLNNGQIENFKIRLKLGAIPSDALLTRLVQSKSYPLLQACLDTKHNPKRDLSKALQVAIKQNDLLATQLLLTAKLDDQKRLALRDILAKNHILWPTAYLTKAWGCPAVEEIFFSIGSSDDDLELTSYIPPKNDLFESKTTSSPQPSHIFPEFDQQRLRQESKLREAALAGNLIAVKYYIEQGVDPYARFENDTIASLVILKKPKNHLKILQACLQTESASQYDLVRAMSHAMASNDLQAVTLILNAHLLDSIELNAVLWGATYGNLVVLIPYLLQQGANPHAKNNNFPPLRISPYELAQKGKLTDILKLFPNPKKHSVENGEESPAKRTKLNGHSEN